MDEEPDMGTEVDPSQLAAMALLARGLHPCIVEIDSEGREVDRWGRVVARLGRADVAAPSFTHITEAHFEQRASTKESPLKVLMTGLVALALVLVAPAACRPRGS